MVRPLTVTGLAVPVPVNAPGFEVAIYPVTGWPPFVDGGENETTALAFPGDAVRFTGADGTVGSGINKFDGADHWLMRPAEFSA